MPCIVKLGGSLPQCLAEANVYMNAEKQLNGCIDGKSHQEVLITKILLQTPEFPMPQIASGQLPVVQ